MQAQSQIHAKPESKSGARGRGTHTKPLKIRETYLTHAN